MTREDEELQPRRGRGRPMEDGARRRIRSVRFDENEEDMLRHLEIETGLSVTDIVRKAVRLYYNFTTKRL